MWTETGRDLVPVQSRQQLSTTSWQSSAPPAGSRRPPRSLSRSTSDPPCTNDHSGPLDGGWPITRAQNLSLLWERIMTSNRFADNEVLALLEPGEVEMSVVISNPALPDNPMIYVSETFERQTGYSSDEAIGKNCRFLQGADTNPHAVQAIREALLAETTFTIDILNYRKDGTPFMNRLRIRPLFDAQGRLTYYVGAQNPV